MNSPAPVAGSIAHQHVAAVLNTILAGRGANGTVVRVLDVGVGDGRFLDYLLRVLPLWQPGVVFEVHGLDVERWTVFEKQGRPHLQSAHPDVDWATRLAFIKPDAPWPFPDGHFDFITSNQVLEHVADKAFFFGELRRCLATGGTGINLFPVTEAIWEGHARMPVVHWLEDPWRRRAMHLFCMLGFNHTWRAGRGSRWNTPAEFASRYSGVLARNTAYSSTVQVRALAAAAGLDVRFTCTKDYYGAKLLSYLGLRPRCYRDLGVLETPLMVLLRHVASITVLLRRADS